MSATSTHTTGLTLYILEYCPFCHRVLDTVEELGLKIPTKETSRDRGARAELIAGGGMSQVPCLRIEKPDGTVEWMYESADIVRYLRGRFGGG
jgi:glutathione S-transferase